jgi:uncharacterized Tic20 family protein
MSVPPEAVPPSPPAAAGGSDDKSLAMITHLSGIVLGFILPLIIWLMNKDNPAKGYLTDEAKEALNFQITILIGIVVCWILMFVLIGFVLIFIVLLANLVFCIIAAVAVSSKGSYRYPIALRLIK